MSPEAGALEVFGFGSEEVLPLYQSEGKI